MDDGYQANSKPTQGAVTDRIRLGDGVQPANGRRRSGITDLAREFDNDVIGAMSESPLPGGRHGPEAIFGRVSTLVDEVKSCVLP